MPSRVTVTIVMGRATAMASVMAMVIAMGIVAIAAIMGMVKRSRKQKRGKTENRWQDM